MKQSNNKHRASMALVAAWLAVTASAQTPSQAPVPEAKPGASATPADALTTPAVPATHAPLSLDQLGWLRGCWSGKVDRREFIETWLPPRGGMMVGISHTIVQDRRHPEPQTQDFEYLRIEARDDGVYYIVIPSGKQEEAFKLTSIGENLGRTAYTFTNPVDQFPQQIVYLRGTEGWLYAQVQGKLDGTPKDVTYPMRHVDCATGATKED